MAALDKEANLPAQDLVSLRNAYAAEGGAGYWRWTRARLERQAVDGDVNAWYLAIANARLGDSDAAFHWLEKMYEARDGSLTFLHADPRLDPLRSDPRFDDLLRRIGFPEN